MEFHEKLQELRKKNGLTQEELAASIYVSRTAVSKWESGRGYPEIESLKAIAVFFSVTVDELLSSGEILTLAEKNGKQKEERLRDLVWGLLDVCMSLLLFLPFFAERAEGVVLSSSLPALTGVALWLKVLYFLFVIGGTVFGIMTLALQSCTSVLWLRSKIILSPVFTLITVLLFIISLQPYAAVFAFALLLVKTLVLLKRY